MPALPGPIAKYFMELPIDNIAEHDAIALLEQIASSAGISFAKKSAVVREIDDAAAGPSSRRKSWQPDLRYRSLVEKLPVVTFMASLNDTLQELYVSPQIETLLGFTQDEWLENPILWFQQLHPDDREVWVNEFARTCSTGANFRAEYRLFARDGRIVWVQGECQLIRDDDGQPVFLQGIAFDITHLKRAAEVENEKRTALAANSAKSEFLAHMSHEIRTPLNGILGMIDLLRSTEMNSTQQRYAQLARQSADALMTVINDVLDFSKIEAGKVEIEEVEFDLGKIAEDLSELLTPVAAKKNLALASIVRSDVPRKMIGDPNRIRQVLTNLVSNALKFTNQGHVGIRVSIDNHDAATMLARVEVEDSGMGIPPDRIGRLFKSFSQVDSSTTRKFGGTGLGLAICKSLVELMGGEIGVRSEINKGTTFWFTLRLKPAVASGSALHPAEALRNIRVLAVEPDPLLRRILIEQLEGRVSPSSVVVTESEAADALVNAIKEGQPFEVALIPYLSLESLRSTLQARSIDSKAGFIAMIEGSDPITEAAVIRMGYAARLQRPLNQSRIMDAIATATVQRTPVASIPPEKASTKQALQGLHLLVAEDNEMNQFVTRETLRRVGCTCEIVGDGALAVEAVRNGRYDGVLMDCQMPGMDGLEASRRIREHEGKTPGSRRIPIIALTAEAIQGDREKCLAAGMDGYVTKPIEPSILFATIGSLVPNTTAPPEPEKPVAIVEPHAPVESPLDLSGLLTRCMGDVDFACRTLEKFEKRALADVDRLRTWLVKGDIDNVKRLAHNLKSAAGYVGAATMRLIATQMEEAGEKQDLRFVVDQLPLLAIEAKRCADYIPQAMRDLAASGSSNDRPNEVNVCKS